MESDTFVPKEGQRDFLCSNKVSHRCPSLGVNTEDPEDAKIEYLADILIGIYLDKKRNDYKPKK